MFFRRAIIIIIPQGRHSWFFRMAAAIGFCRSAAAIAVDSQKLYRSARAAAVHVTPMRSSHHLFRVEDLVEAIFREEAKLHTGLFQ